MDYQGLISPTWNTMSRIIQAQFVVVYFTVGILCTASTDSPMTTQPTHAQFILTNDSDGTKIMSTYATPKHTKSTKSNEEDGVPNLLNIPEGVNTDNLSKPSNTKFYTAGDFVTKPSSTESNYPEGVEAPAMYRGVQRTTAAEVDSRLEHSSTMNTETSTTTTEIFESEKLSNNSENERTTIVPYNLNEYGSESQYEVDLSEVELLKTTEKTVAVNEDEKNNVEDRKVKRRDEENKEKDKRQRNRKGKQKGRNHSRKSDGRGLSDEESLLEELFGDYNPSARPVIDSSSTVPVQIQFSLMHIKDLNVINQVLTTTGLLILEWTDERLIWDPEEHNNMTEIIIEGKTLWRPEFAVINGAEKIYEDYTQFRAVISQKGRVHWEPGGVFKTMCEIDITYYPFDEQKCELTFGAWSYHTSKMNLTNSSSLINMDSYKLNGEWEIYSTMVKRNEFFYDCCPNERFANVAFALYMRRRHTFYVLNVILPSIMTSVLLLSVFFCTPGQKVQIGVVVLLSFRIFLLNVAGNIPKTSDHIPLLGIYLTCTMAITTLSMVLTVFVLNLHHVNDRPVPEWAKKIVFFYLARMMGMCSLSRQYVKEHKRRKSSLARGLPANSLLYRRASQNNSVSHDPEGEEQTTPIMELQNRTANGTPEISKQNHNVGVTEHQVAFPGLHRPREKEEKEDFTKDWRKMAEVFDRLFFWLFLLAILISTLVLFHPLTNHYLQGHLLKRDT